MDSLNDSVTYRSGPMAGYIESTHAAPKEGGSVPTSRRTSVSQVVRMLAIAVAYFLAAKLGREITFVGGLAAPLWPPAGIAIASLLLFGRGVWPGIALGAFMAPFTAPGVSVNLALATGVGATLGAVAGATLVRYYTPGPVRLGRVSDTLRFLALGGLVASLISPTFGVPILAVDAGMTAIDAWNTWLVWWLGDTLGVWVVAPLLLTWLGSESIDWTRRQFAEALVLFGLLVVVGQVVFGGLIGGAPFSYPLSYLPFPLLAWAAFRFGPRGASLATALIIAASLWGTSRGFGPFVRDPEFEGVVLAWVFAGVVTVTTLVVTAIVAERHMALESLETERGFATQVMNALGQGVVVTDADGRFAFVNPAFERIVGRPASKLLGQSPEKFVHPDDLPAIHQTFSGQPEPASSYESKIVRPDGSIVHALVTAVPHVSDGESIGTIAVATDVTHRRLSEDSLRHSELRYRSLVNQAPEGIAIFDRTLRFLEANPALCEMLGYSREKLLEYGAPEVVADKDAVTWPSMIKELLAGQVVTWQGVLRRRDGMTIEAEANVKALSDGTFRAIVRDVTEQKKVEDQLRFQADILRHVREAIIVLNRDGDITYWNDGATTIYGYHADEMVGRSPLVMYPGNQGDPVRRDLEEIEAGTYAKDDRRRIRKDGREVWVDLKPTIMRDGDGEITAYVAVANDITERRQLEMQLMQSQKMEAIGRLAGGIAHDFNNLITAILGYGDIALDSFTQHDERRSHIEQIMKAGRRAGDLTGQLLAFARRQMVEPKVISLNDLVSSMEDMLRRLIGEDVTLTTHIADDLWSVRVDPAQFEQVLVNLAVNARDAMPHGGNLTIATGNVTLDENFAKYHPPAASGPYVCLAVADTGIGMSSDTLSHVFEPFFTTKSVSQGTGLGLATCYGVVKQADGYIWGYSESGKGSRFEIYLPPIAETPVELPPARQEATVRKGRETILLAEDEHLVMDMVKQSLQAHGYKVLTATGGREALAVAREYEGQIDLLVTDVVMPRMSGRELAEQLRLERPDIRVLFVSGYNEDAIMRSGALPENSAFYAKPFTAVGIAQRVRAVLDESTKSLSSAAPGVY